jgi:hypothetical protein
MLSPGWESTGTLASAPMMTSDIAVRAVWLGRETTVKHAVNFGPDVSWLRCRCLASSGVCLCSR